MTPKRKAEIKAWLELPMKAGPVSTELAIELFDALNDSNKSQVPFVPYSTDEKGYPFMEIEAETGNARLLVVMPQSATSIINQHGKRS